MKAILKSTGETVYILSSDGELRYSTVLFPFDAPAKSGAMGDIRRVKSDKLKIVKATTGLEIAK